MTKISVLMPVYNAERYVAEAVESILAQTYRDFEFLIINDGSTDGSLAILERYAARDARIRLISRPNTGLVGALNEGLSLAQGHLIARMDADDVALPRRFELQVDFLDHHPEVVCLGGAIQMIDEKGRYLTQIHPPQTNEDIQERALTGHTPMTHPTVMMRNECVAAVGGYRPETYPAEDLDLFLRLGERGQLASLPEAVLKYREHANSICQKNRDVQMDRMISVATQARERRHLPPHKITLVHFRSDMTRTSRHRFAIRNGWWAFGSGERRTALHYGLKAIEYQPWNAAGWKLLACVILKSK